ncbi:MAG: aminotransferase class I/II-fold pyridoxal phosphate-dependent enzyme, partial [Planctomycetota bacterium]
MPQTSYFRPCIDAMEGYVPGAQPQGRPHVKLNANENPYPPSPHVLEALHGAVSERLRLYPDAMATALREQIARFHGMAVEQVLVGNGSDDLLTMILRSFVGEGEGVAAPRPTYPLYEVLVAIQN